MQLSVKLMLFTAIKGKSVNTIRICPQFGLIEAKYAQKGDLNRHIETKHTEIRKFECVI